MHKHRLNAASDARSHGWTHFLQQFRIFVYVMALLVAIDVIGGTEDFFVHWVAGIWGAILGMHFIETLFFGGGAFGFAGGGHCFGQSDASVQVEPPTNVETENIL